MANKMKTKSAVKKRFKVKSTSSGIKIAHRSANRSHILTKKSSKRKRQLRSPSLLSKCDHVLVIRCLG